MTYSFLPMDLEGARAIFTWRYEAPYSLYNIIVSADKIETELAYFADPQNRYYRILDRQGTLIGHCCFGAEGKVPGGDYSLDALDLGIGIRPDLTGQGQGHQLIAAMLDFARETFQPGHFRATIAAFNQRSQRAFIKAGFAQTGDFTRPRDGRVFLIFTRKA